MMKNAILILLVIIFATSANAQTYHNLESGSFIQNWTNTELLTTANDWSGVPSIRGFRGDNLTVFAGVDPQVVLNGDDSAPVLNITVNNTNPNTITSGGLLECEIADPVVAFQGSGTADAPYLVIFINATNVNAITVAYKLRDVDGSADNAIQPVALQYRVGTSGNFTNVPSGFVADASTGPSLATLETNVSTTLPSACNNSSQLQIRIITANADGSDELIGIDDIIIGGTIVPVELTSFTATLKGRGVELAWNTATEVNNYGFEIERMKLNDRSIGSLNQWTKIGFVEGYGTTNAPKSYTFVDGSASGTVAYRLKQIDRDGSFEYSNQVEVTVASPVEFALMQNYPNPFNPATSINYTLPASGLVTLKVYDMLGKEVATLVNGMQDAGAKVAQFDASQLPSGMYFYSLRANNFTATKKMLLLK